MNLDPLMDASPWEVVEEVQREAALYRELVRSTGGGEDEGTLELAGADELVPTDETLEAMVVRVLAADGGDGEGEAEALYQQLEGTTPGRVYRRQFGVPSSRIRTAIGS